jgi:hypothetical protein
MKSILINFFDIKGTVHFKFIPQGQIINQAYYVELLKRLLEAVRRKRPELWPSVWILHHYNASAYKALSIKQILNQISITEMQHLPCYPNFPTNDFWLFSKIKSALKGRVFQVIEDIKNVTTALKAIVEQEFEKFFQ